MRSSGVHRRLHAIALASDIDDFADDIRRVFQELGRAFGAESLAPECSPVVDVYETDDAIEVVVDLPGVDPASIRLMAKASGLLIAGDKAARRAPAESSSAGPRGGEATFHLVERGYGRFARVVRLGRPCDIAHARATLVNGELRVTLRKIDDRRGKAIHIPIT